MTAIPLPAMLSSGFSIGGLAGSVAVGLVFLTAGMEKWRHRVILPGVVANYRLLPEGLVGPVAFTLPLIEMATGAGLIAGFTPLPALAGMSLLLLFAAAMAVNIRRGRSHIDCGCGGPALRQQLSWVLVARNLVLAALLLPRLLPSGPLSGADIFTAGAAGLGLFLAYSLFQILGSLIASHSVALRR